MLIKLSVGMNLECKYRGIVTVTQVDERGFTVTYKDKEYAQKEDDIGRILFPVRVSEKQSNYASNGAKSCEICNLVKTGDCLGKDEVCEFFEPAFSIADEEKVNWPHLGDASTYRLYG